MHPRTVLHSGPGRRAPQPEPTGLRGPDSAAVSGPSVALHPRPGRGRAQEVGVRGSGRLGRRREGGRRGPEAVEGHAEGGGRAGREGVGGYCGRAVEKGETVRRKRTWKRGAWMRTGRDGKERGGKRDAGEGQSGVGEEGSVQKRQDRSGGIG